MNAPSIGESARRGLLNLKDGQIELLKWIGFSTMLIDHFGRYAYGLSVESWAFAVSRVTYPIFAFVLAFNLARPGDRAARVMRTARRLALWAAISVLPSWWARDAFLPVNVLMTLALGAFLYGVLEAKASSAAILAAVVTTGATGCFAEVSAPGVLLVPAIAAYLSTRRTGYAIATITAIALIAGLNLAVGGLLAMIGTFAAIPIVMAAARSTIAPPRSKWIFYVAYPAHLAAVAVARWFAA